MPTYNAEKHVAESIESVLKQSFEDFDFIIVDDGSTDKTLSIIRSYNDNRIKIIQNKHDFVGSLNIGLDSASSKYIARMDADDIMHIDRLRIQHSIMENQANITICSSWVIPFGENITAGNVSRTFAGFVNHPLLHLLQTCFLFHPTIMLRTDFFRQHMLRYDKNYTYAEDYKLWVEVAKLNGIFYVETQPLLYYRISESQVSFRKHKEQRKISTQIRKEVLKHLIALIKENYPSLSDIESSMNKAKTENLLNNDDIFKFFYSLFLKIKTS